MRADARPSLSLIARSYLADLRQWIGRLVTGYALACGFVLFGAVSLLVAISIGGAAAFHALELRYGIWIAYAALAGIFLLLGLLGLGTGRVMLGRPAPAAPRPSRQVDMLKRAIAVPVAARLIATSRAGINADPTTQVLAAAAVVMLVGWLAASRSNRPRDVIQD
ncbi:hypothetical protein ACE103_29830 [Bradyrhizobium sp. ma5]|uniref:hypothetical protein n=1 Tax=Bradyrhizobium sp. ma5 TaxID=3344828 RepID=UPI0035D42C1E